MFFVKETYMRKMRIVGISSLSAGLALLVMIMANFAVVWANMTEFDGPTTGASNESITPIQVTLDSGWIDVMQWGVVIFFLVAIVAGCITRSYGLLAIVGSVCFTAAALFQQLVTDNLSWMLLLLAGAALLGCIWLAFSDDRKLTVVPKAPDDLAGVHQAPVSRTGGGMDN